MSMWRQPKAFADDLGRLQQDDLVMANFTTHNYTTGSPVELPLVVSHYSISSLAGATLLWQTSDGQSGVLPLSKIPEPSAVVTEGTLQFKAASVDAPTPEYLRLQLVSPTGATLAQNSYRFAVYPQKPEAPQMTVVIHDPVNQLQTLHAALVANGRKVVDAGAGNEKAVWLSSMLDDETSARLSQGGTVLLLAADGAAVPTGKPLRIVPRAGSDLSGDWVSNFNWVLSSSTLWKPLAPVIEDSILGWEAASVMPEFVIDGVREEDAQHVQAGVFYGWLNSNRAYLAELPEGPGRMLVTTFRFEGYGHDPFATLLLDQMLSTAAAKP
jgi:hypothetical protein